VRFAALIVQLLELLDTPGLLDREECFRVIAEVFNQKVGSRLVKTFRAVDSASLAQLLSVRLHLAALLIVQLLPGDRLHLTRVQLLGRLLHTTTVIAKEANAKRIQAPLVTFTAATPAAETVLEFVQRISAFTANVAHQSGVQLNADILEDSVRHMTLQLAFLYALSSAYPDLAIDTKQLRDAVDANWAIFRRIRAKGKAPAFDALPVMDMRKDLVALALTRFAGAAA